MIAHDHDRPDYARRARWGGKHDPGNPEVVLRVERVRLDRQGYARRGRGRYYGVGHPVWSVAGDGYDIDFSIRAPDWKAAMREVLRMYPRARIERA